MLEWFEFKFVNPIFYSICQLAGVFRVFCCGQWEGWVCKPVKHTSWTTVLIPTDHPKSVRNCCAIKLFVASSCHFDF